MQGGAADAGVVAVAGEADAGARCRRRAAPGAARRASAGSRTSSPAALTAAADDDLVRVEDVHEVGDADADALAVDRAGPRRPRRRPSCAAATAALPSSRPWRCASAVSASPSALPSSESGCGQRVGLGGRAVRRGRRATMMCPSSAARAGRAAEAVAVEDDAAADAGAEREHHEHGRDRRPGRRAPRPARRTSRRCRRRRARRDVPPGPRAAARPPAGCSR